MTEPDLFPVFLKLEGRRVLVVGAGPVGASKVAALATTGARITVVAPEVHPDLLRAPVELHRRKFRPSDLDGVWLVVAAAPPEVNRAVDRHARKRQIFVNAADDPQNATAYLGGTLRRDGVTIAISTNGRSPALAGLLREGLDALLPGDLDRWFRRADVLKRRWRSRGVPMTARRPQLLDALARLYEARTRPVRAAGRRRRA